MYEKKGQKKGTVDVWVPAYRTDFMHKVDFAEEFAIGYGYYNVPTEIYEGGVGEYHPLVQLQNNVRRIMVGAGYLETFNFILTSKDNYSALNLPFNGKENVTIRNPVSKEWNTTRTLILPVIMKLLQFNRSEEKPIHIFEVGDVVMCDKKSSTGGAQDLHVCTVAHHADAEFTEIRSAFDFLVETMGIDYKITVKAGEHPSLISGRSGLIMLDDEEIGFIGEIHPEVLENFGLGYPTAVFEINLSPLLTKEENRIE